MRLNRFVQQHDYVFSLDFADGSHSETDLAPLIAPHVSLQELHTARIDPEWGCLEFKNGTIDIAPQTLHHWALTHNLCHH